MTKPPTRVHALKLIALALSFLVLSLPAASAAQITVTIFHPVSSQTATLTKPGSLSATYSSGNVQLTFSISPTPLQILLFACKDKSPANCGSVTAQTLTANTPASLSWASLADKTTGFPQKARVLLLVQAPGSGAWQNYWYELTRADSSSFLVSESTASLTVNADKVESVQLIKSYIESSGAIPFRWATSLTIQGASSIEQLSSSTPPSPLSGSTTSGDTLSSLAQTVAFLFPATANGIASVPALVNPTYTPGNGVCESSAGENKLNGCTDCDGCTSAEYCDPGSQSCKPAPSISSVQATSQLPSCSAQIQLTAMLANPAAGLALNSASATLAGSVVPATCALKPSSLECTLSAPSNCIPGKQYTPNTFSATVHYPDGAGQKTKTLTASFPTVTVQSAVCGNAQCESALGETQATCCSDCGCPTGQSCSSTGCVSDDISVQATGPLPRAFASYAPSGLPFTFQLKVTTAHPFTLASVACTSTCTVDGSPCASSSCDASCGPFTSGTASCSGTAFLSGYDSKKSYILTPTIPISLSYTASAGPVTKQFAPTLLPMGVGPSYCGDGVPGPGETPATCCRDTGCADTQFCDTASLTVPAATDTCRSLPTLSVLPAPITEFSGTEQPHTAELEAVVSNAPQSLALISASCTLPDTPGCRASCQLIPPYAASGGDAHYSCSVTLPAIPNYAKHARFSAADKKIHIPAGGSLKLSVQHNNGAAIATRELTAALPAFTLTPTPDCGDAKCDSALGESKSTCCRDCGCDTNQFCYRATDVSNGQCLETTAIQLSLLNATPSPYPCALNVGTPTTCQFTQPLTAWFSITNPPLSSEITEAHYSLQGVPCAGKAQTCTVTCTPPENGVFSCPLFFQSFNTTAGTGPQQLKLQLTLRYLKNGLPFFQNLTSTSSVELARKKSKELRACEDLQKKTKDQEQSIEDKKKLVTIVLAVMGAVTVGFCTAFIASSDPATKALFERLCLCGTAVTSCTATVLLPMLNRNADILKSLEGQQQQACKAKTADKLKKASKDAGGSGIDAVTIILGLFCLAGTTLCIMSLANGGHVFTKTGAERAAEAQTKLDEAKAKDLISPEDATARQAQIDALKVGDKTVDAEKLKSELDTLLGPLPAAGAKVASASEKGNPPSATSRPTTGPQTTTQTTSP